MLILLKEDASSLHWRIQRDRDGNTVQPEGFLTRPDTNGARMGFKIIPRHGLGLRKLKLFDPTRIKNIFFKCPYNIITTEWGGYGLYAYVK